MLAYYFTALLIQSRRRKKTSIVFAAQLLWKAVRWFIR